MKAKHLRPGQKFTVDPPDTEGPIRACLTNDKQHGIRWAFLRSDTYWCSMGDEVEVEVVDGIYDIEEHRMIQKLQQSEGDQNERES